MSAMTPPPMYIRLPPSAVGRTPGDGRRHAMLLSFSPAAVTKRRAVVLGVALVVAAFGGQASTSRSAPPTLPAPNASIPREPKRLAHTLLVTTRALDDAIDRWRATGNPSVAGPSRDVHAS